MDLSIQKRKHSTESEDLMSNLKLPSDAPLYLLIIVFHASIAKCFHLFLKGIDSKYYGAFCFVFVHVSFNQIDTEYGLYIIDDDEGDKYTYALSRANTFFGVNSDTGNIYSLSEIDIDTVRLLCFDNLSMRSLLWYFFYTEYQQDLFTKPYQPILQK